MKQIDPLQLIADIKRRTMPYYPVAKAYVEAGDEMTYEAGFAIGYARAITDVLLIVTDTPTPPKANPSETWSNRIRSMMGNAPDAIPRDENGVPYVH